MKPFGDYSDEMPLDEFSDGMQAFVSGVRAASSRTPSPSPQLAELLATGVSVDQPKTRSVIMRIKAYVAGMGVAAKVVLGAGVAAAATTGAGAAGVLPDPVQHAVAATVETVTPFAMPDPHKDGDHGQSGKAEGDRHDQQAGAPTPTTVAKSNDGSDHHDGDSSGGGITPGEHHEPGVAPTTTTAHHEEHPIVTTSTTAVHEEPHPTTTTTTPPVTVPPGTGDGDHNNPESMSLQCYTSPEPNRISCRWTASSNADHYRYQLLRTSSDSTQGRVVFSTETKLEYSDATVTPGVTYTYRVVSLRSDNTVDSHSNSQTFTCCTFATASS